MDDGSPLPAGWDTVTLGSVTVRWKVPNPNPRRIEAERENSAARNKAMTMAAGGPEFQGFVKAASSHPAAKKDDTAYHHAPVSPSNPPLTRARALEQESTTPVDLNHQFSSSEGSLEHPCGNITITKPATLPFEDHSPPLPDQHEQNGAMDCSSGLQQLTPSIGAVQDTPLTPTAGVDSGSLGAGSDTNEVRDLSKLSPNTDKDMNMKDASVKAGGLELIEAHLREKLGSPMVDLWLQFEGSSEVRNVRFKLKDHLLTRVQVPKGELPGKRMRPAAISNWVDGG